MANFGDCLKNMRVVCLVNAALFDDLLTWSVEENLRMLVANGLDPRNSIICYTRYPSEDLYSAIAALFLREQGYIVFPEGILDYPFIDLIGTPDLIAVKLGTFQDKLIKEGIIGYGAVMPELEMLGIFGKEEGGKKDIGEEKAVAVELRILPRKPLNEARRTNNTQLDCQTNPLFSTSRGIPLPRGTAPPSFFRGIPLPGPDLLLEGCSSSASSGHPKTLRADRSPNKHKHRHLPSPVLEYLPPGFFLREDSHRFQVWLLLLHPNPAAEVPGQVGVGCAEMLSLSVTPPHPHFLRSFRRLGSPHPFSTEPLDPLRPSFPRGSEHSLSISWKTKLPHPSPLDSAFSGLSESLPPSFYDPDHRSCRALSTNTF